MPEHEGGGLREDEGGGDDMAMEDVPHTSMEPPTEVVVEAEGTP